MPSIPLTPEGDYLCLLRGELDLVRIKETYIGSHPDKRTVLKAHYLTGFPRFPIPLTDLIEWGATFREMPKT